MGFEIGKFLFYIGYRTRSIAFGFQITTHSIDLDLGIIFLAVERATWND